MQESYLYFSIPGWANEPHVSYTWLLMAGLLVVSLVVTRGLQLVPYRGQNLFEALFDGVFGLIEDIMGPQGRRYFPLIATLALFILTSNLMGLIPGAISPTANLNTTAGCAITVFLATHYVGLRTHGWRYVRQFTGPVWWLAPIMFPIEIISHFTRPLSLSVRLFVNVFADETVLLILFFLGVLFKWLYIPMVIPSLMIFFSIFVAMVQAFVFVLLSMIYLSGALEEDH
jgi:F-type H+-transporting ATPase subunit a